MHSIAFSHAPFPACAPSLPAESPTAFELHADAPGMGPDDVKVELQEGVLMVRAGPFAAGCWDTDSSASQGC